MCSTSVCSTNVQNALTYGKARKVRAIKGYINGHETDGEIIDIVKNNRGDNMSGISKQLQYVIQQKCTVYPTWRTYIPLLNLNLFGDFYNYIFIYLIF